MSWSRGLAAGLVAVFLAACGFQPLYKKESADVDGVTGYMSRVRIMTVRAKEPEFDRLGQQMHNLLIQRLNPEGTPDDPLYRLECEMTVQRERTGVRITDEATRARLTVQVRFRLFPASSLNALYNGTEQSANSYNVVDSQFATLSAENDAALRAVREISDSIKLRLGIYFQRERGK